MRLRSAAVLFALFAAPAAQAQFAQPQRAPIRAGTPCELAAIVFAQAVAVEQTRGMIYDAEPFKPIKLSAGARDPGPPPGVPADLATRWNGRGPDNLLQACPKVAVTLPAWIRLATDADRAAVRGATHSPYLHQVSAPVTNAAGDRVLIEVRSRCAGLCGGGVVRHFQKTGRGWVERPNAALWMS